MRLKGSNTPSDPREKEANELADNTLIPEARWNENLKVGCNSLSPQKIVITIATVAERYASPPLRRNSRQFHLHGWKDFCKIALIILFNKQWLSPLMQR